jgi:hypothetical protein
MLYTTAWPISRTFEQLFEYDLRPRYGRCVRRVQYRSGGEEFV